MSGPWVQLDLTKLIEECDQAVAELVQAMIDEEYAEALDAAYPGFQEAVNAGIEVALTEDKPPVYTAAEWSDSTEYDLGYETGWNEGYNMGKTTDRYLIGYEDGFQEGLRERESIVTDDSEDESYAGTLPTELDEA